MFINYKKMLNIIIKILIKKIYTKTIKSNYKQINKKYFK